MTDAAFDEALRIAEAWGRDHGGTTGMWLDRRHRDIGVGIPHGDEIETTEALRALVPPGIGIRTRVAPARTVELRQLQSDVFGFLEEEHLWGRWAVSLDVDPGQDVLRVGVRDGTPEDVRTRIHERFSGAPLVVVPGMITIAL